MKNLSTSLIVPAMKRSLFLVALIVVSAAPMFAQIPTNEFGFILGGSRRFIDDAVSIADPPESDFIESNFSFSNTSFEIFWAMPIDEDVYLRFKGGQIETQIGIPGTAPDPENPGEEVTTRRDVPGEVAHIESTVEYRFDEVFGSTGLFAGIGYYRLSAEDEQSQTNWGVNAGVRADFPITRRYGFIMEGSYHWTSAKLQPRFMTVGGGFRVSF